MEILYSLGFQLASIGLFAIFLTAGFYFLKERPELAVWLFFLAAVSLALAGALFVLERLLYEPETSGLLGAAHDPDPPLPPGCHKDSPDSLGIFYGNSVAFNSSERVTIVKMGDERLLTATRTPKGLAISAKVFSEDGRIIAEIADNVFTINPNNYFKRERPDRSTLIVYDQFNNLVLSVRYLNPLAVKVLGIFHYKDRAPIIITEDATRIGGMMLSHVCSKDSAAVIGN